MLLSENQLEGIGESGIRTHGRVSPTHAFQACSFNHSDISPFDSLRSLTASRVSGLNSLAESRSGRPNRAPRGRHARVGGPNEDGETFLGNVARAAEGRPRAPGARG